MRACSRRWWLRVAATGLLVGGALVFHVVPAEAAPVDAPAFLAGVTSQSYPSYFRISANGKVVQAGVIALRMSCASGASFATPDQFAHIRIGPNGGVRAEFNLPPTTLSGGGTYSGTDLMIGEVNRKRTQVAGVWRLQVSYTFADGTADQCDSGPVRFADSR